MSLKQLPAVHLISGLGADRRAFSNLRLNESFNKKYIEWLKPEVDETIQQYAQRLVKHYQVHEGDILIGLSFGGMMAIEMSKHIKISRIILISSASSRKDFSVGFRMMSYLKLNRLLTKDKVVRPNPVNYFVFGAETDEQRASLDEILLNADPDFTLWAIDEMIHWENRVIPENLIKIHGDKDRIFPVKKTRVNHIIRGGSHLMVLSRADEISKIINQYLEKFPAK